MPQSKPASNNNKKQKTSSRRKPTPEELMMAETERRITNFLNALYKGRPPTKDPQVTSILAHIYNSELQQISRLFRTKNIAPAKRKTASRAIMHKACTLHASPLLKYLNKRDFLGECMSFVSEETESS
jgi:hypothetical protein